MIAGVRLKKQIQIASPPNSLVLTISPTGCDAKAEVKASGLLLGAGPFWFAHYTSPLVDADPDDSTSSPPPSPPYYGESPSGSKTATFSGLVPGVVYSFVVYDQGSSCYYYDKASVPLIPSTTITETRIVTPVTCKGAKDGTVEFIISNFPAGTTSISYEVFDQNTNVLLIPSKAVTMNGLTGTGMILGLDKGKYYIVYTYIDGPNVGCKTGTVPFEIQESLLDFSVTASIVKNDNCTSNAGVISAIAQGGTNLPENLSANPPVHPYQYLIISGTDITTVPSRNDPRWGVANTFNAESGNWVVWAKDSYNCIKFSKVNVPLDTKPDISIATANTCVSEGNFQINVANTVGAGIGPYKIRLYQGTPNGEVSARQVVVLGRG